MRAFRAGNGEAELALQPAPDTARALHEHAATADPGQQRLWLAIHVPRLSLHALGVAVPDAPPRAVSERGRRALIAVVDDRAAAAGVSVGMSVSGACGLCPGLSVHVRDEAAEQAALQGLAAWSGRYTSLTSLQPPRGLLLEIGGSLRLFGGLSPLLGAIRDDLGDLGYEVELGVATTATAAWMLARAGDCRPAILGSRLSDRLAPLALSCMDPSPAVLEDFQALGLHSVGDCMRLPRDALGRRFGAGLVQHLDRALGLRPDPRVPWSAPGIFQRRVDFPWGTRDQAVLLEAARLLLHELCGLLCRRAAGARTIGIQIAHARGPCTAFTLQLVSLNRDPAHLLILLSERLQRLRLPADALYLGMRVDALLPLAPVTPDLYDSVAHDAGMSPQHLVERLQARLGRHHVHGLIQRADPRPEHASRRCAWGERGGGVSGNVDAFAAFMPVWLLAAPRRLECHEGHPHADGALHLEQGPQRIEAGWWDGHDVARDYYVARNPHGARYWVFRCCRPPNDWYLHGIFS